MSLLYPVANTDIYITMINIFAILDQKYFWVNSHICHLLQSSCILALCSDCRVHHFLAIQRYGLQFSCAQTAVKISFPGQPDLRDLQLIYREKQWSVPGCDYLPRNVFRNIFKKKCGNNLWLCMAADLICIYHRLGSIGMRWYYQNEMRTLWRI